jgi:hypothetical protein
MTRRKRRRVEPYIAPPGSPPLRDVFISLVQKSKQLNALDDKISMSIATLERKLIEHRIERVVSVRLPDGADLGWSRDRRSRRWRFVIRDGEDVMELRACTEEERAEVFTCGAMEKLLKQAGIVQEAR